MIIKRRKKEVPDITEKNTLCCVWGGKSGSVGLLVFKMSLTRTFVKRACRVLKGVEESNYAVSGGFRGSACMLGIRRDEEGSLTFTEGDAEARSN